MTLHEGLVALLVLAGLGQLVLCGASPFIPIVLGWPAQIKVLPKLLRQVFWTYAGYILGSHLVFAGISLFAASILLDGSVSATILCAWMTLWWGVRLAIHLVGFDLAEVPNQGWHRGAKLALGALFAALTSIYVLAVLFNVNLIG